MRSILHHITPLVVNYLGGGHTNTHANTHTCRHSWTEAILRNQALQLAHTWFNNACKHSYVLVSGEIHEHTCSYVHTYDTYIVRLYDTYIVRLYDTYIVRLYDTYIVRLYGYRCNIRTDTVFIISVSVVHCSLALI